MSEKLKLTKKELERKMKEIEEEAATLFETISSLTLRARQELLVNIRPEIRKLEKMNESLKKKLKEVYPEFAVVSSKDRADGN